MSVPLAVALPAMQQKMATQRRRDEEDARWTDVGRTDGWTRFRAFFNRCVAHSFLLSELAGCWMAVCLAWQGTE